DANLLDPDLMGMSLVLSLLLLIFEFAEIHDSANRRSLGRGDLHQIEVDLSRGLDRLVRRHDTQLLPVIANHTNGASTNLFVDPLCLLLRFGSQVSPAFSLD